MIDLPADFLDETKHKDELMVYLKGWSIIQSDGKEVLFKSFRFKSFKSCLDYIQIIGEYAEQWNHHPKWTNQYAKLDVEWTTNDVGGVITILDIKMAFVMDTIFKDFTY